MIRDQKVMIDIDLAELYGVPTKCLNERVHRNTNTVFLFRIHTTHSAEPLLDLVPLLEEREATKPLQL